MAPPHKDSRSKQKPKHAKPAEHHGAGSRPSKKQQCAGKTRRDAEASHGNSENKVTKKKKVRQRGGRGRGRGKGAKNHEILEKPASTIPRWTQRAIADQVRSYRRLDTLPPEIRLQIWELVLKKRKWIRVEQMFEFPPLCKVNRQLLSEATRIYLTVNKFELVVERFSPQLPILVKSLEIHHSCRLRTEMTIDPSHHWANLCTWATMVHSGQSVCVPPCVRDMSRSYTIAYTVMGIALATMGKPWTVCMALLEQYRLTLEKFDDGWS